MSLVSELKSKFRIELISQLISAAIGAILFVLLARLLEPEEYGLFFLSISVFTALGVISKLGLAESAARYLSQYKEDTPDQVGYIFQTTIVYLAGTISSATLILLIFHNEISHLMDELALSPYLFLGSLFVVGITLNNFVRISAQGLEKTRFGSLIKLSNSVLKFILAVLAVLAGFGGLGALFGYIVSSLLVGIVGLYVLYSYIQSNFKKGTRLKMVLSAKFSNIIYQLH